MIEAVGLVSICGTISKPFKSFQFEEDINETTEQAKTVFRNLLDLSGKVDVSATSVVVTLDKRAHNPYLVASGLADQTTTMPWFGDKKLIIQFA